MIHALIAAAALGGGFDAAACTKKIRVARVHLVDGMPFVDALRRSIGVQRNVKRPNVPPANVFRVYDGAATIGYLSFAGDGSVEVSGVLEADPAGRFVDLDEPPTHCPRPIRAMRVTLRPLP